MKTDRLTTRKQEIRKQENVFRKQKQKTETIQKTKLKAMKTTNNAQKTGNSKFENPASKTAAVILSLVLISFTVSANGFWKQLLVNNTFGKMAVLMVDQENSELLAHAAPEPAAHTLQATGISNNFFVETAKENSLSIESWMTKDTNFGKCQLTDRAEAETSLRLENWMVSNPYFNASVVQTENEPVLKLEAWMTDENRWVR